MNSRSGICSIRYSYQDSACCMIPYLEVLYGILLRNFTSPLFWCQSLRFWATLRFPFPTARWNLFSLQKITDGVIDKTVVHRHANMKPAVRVSVANSILSTVGVMSIVLLNTCKRLSGGMDFIIYMFIAKPADSIYTDLLRLPKQRVSRPFLYPCPHRSPFLVYL